MRTTVELDADLATKLRSLARERGISFDEALKSTLRRGLVAEARATAPPYRLPARRLGLRPGVDLEHALRLAADLEDAATVHEHERRI